MIERVCRASALILAGLALVDPGCSLQGASGARVRLLATAGATPDDVTHVREALAPTVDVVETPDPEVDATVVIGRAAPRRPPAGPMFAVVPPSSSTSPEVRAIELPEQVDLESRVTATATVAVPAGAAGPLKLTLLSGGIPHDAQSLPVAAGSDTVRVPLTFVPAQPGLTLVHISASLPGSAEATAVATTHVVQQEHRVLVHDARPSWAATFVRRALESDPRLNVTARSVVSRGLATEVGAPPALDSAAALDDFDVIVVGAAEALTPAQVTSLERYLRAREGAVVLLPTDDDALGVLRPLTAISRWNLDRRPALETLSADGLEWSASEFLWPSTWPAGAESLTTCPETPRCAVWRRPIGGGRVIVSSALDGWRTRAGTDVDYAEFWRVQVANAAAATPERVAITFADALVETGATVHAEIEARGLPSLTAEWQDTLGSRATVRLWPAGAQRWRAEWSAPPTPGRYRLVLTAGDVQASREFMVVDAGTVQRPLPSDADALALMARAHGGQSEALSDLAALPPQMAGLVEAPPERVWHPFRSAWMIVPFAGLLSVEWWLRRRRGAR